MDEVGGRWRNSSSSCHDDGSCAAEPDMLAVTSVAAAEGACSKTKTVDTVYNTKKIPQQRKDRVV